MTIKNSLSDSTIAERVYRTMREDIASATLKPGDRLVVRQLAQQFGASTIPVLEALRRLESEGLTVSYPNAGSQVKIWDDNDIRGTYLVREALEGVTCRLFAESASPLEKAQLAEYGRQFDRACREGDAANGRRIDVQLHLHIARSGGNRNTSSGNPSSLVRFVENSCLLTATIYSSCFELTDIDIRESEGWHDAMIAALIEGDADNAERLGKEHVRNTMDEVLRRWTQKQIASM